MRKDILVIAEHLNGKLAEITWEMLGKAHDLAEARGGRLYAVLIGQGVRPFSNMLGMADAVICVEDDRLAHFTPEMYRQAVAQVILERQPWLTLIGSTSMGLDVAIPLSADLGTTLLTSCRDLRIENGTCVATSQLYGGKMLMEIELESESAIALILSGAFRAEKGTLEKPVAVETCAFKAPSREGRMQFSRLIQPEAGDVDITKVPVLVCIGRGIQNQENLPLAQQLAELLGGAVAASRPVIDQGWLPLSRQVGKSGMTVKPKLCFSLGISGAPEHVEGMKDAGLIIAVNKDPGAPIFNVAHYGICADLLELLPPLLEAVQQRKQAGS